MNMWVFNYKPKFYFFLCAWAFLFMSSCKKEVEKTYIYTVNDVTVSQTGASKPNVKSTIEFISIAYSDLFGNTISQNILTDLSIAYLAFGDKKIIEDLIIRNFLNTPGVSIPTSTSMKADIPKFVKESYSKFYNREPNEFELWQLTNLITNDLSTTPEIVYYAFMTSNEYRYY